MKNKTEFKIGEEVHIGLMTLICTERNIYKECIGCYFDNEEGCPSDKIIGYCSSYSRSDKKDVIFKLKEGENEKEKNTT